jgi:PIN domain nuclease of toxin-antitoxin system
MRLLIDTQIFIWAVIDSDHLSEHARRILLDAAEVFVSAA